MRRKIGAAVLTLAMLLSMLVVPFASATDAAPLKLVPSVNGDTVTLAVVTTKTITLSNYDIRLSWDTSEFSLSDMTNGQPALFSVFQKNIARGKIGATSGGSNVTVSAGETLSTYVLERTAGAAAGTYSFTLFVKDAANEDGDALSWKGAEVTETLTLAAPAAAKITGVQPNGAKVNVTAVCRVDSAVLCCAAYRASGQMAAVRTTQAVNDGSEHSYSLDLGTTAYSYVKVFVMGAGWKPLCESVREPSL